MEQFNTQEKVMELFAKEGCWGNENCCFITHKDTTRAKSGLVGGMEYPYDGILINKTENGIGMIFLKYKNALFLKPDIANFTLSDIPFQFIPTSDIRRITVKKHAPLSKSKKSLIIETADRKHCLMVYVDEPKLPYHNEGFARFMSQYAK